MHRFTYRVVAILTVVSVAACDQPAPTEAIRPLASVASTIEDGWEGGAFVLNSGEGKNAPSCFFANRTYVTYDATLVRTPSGNWVLNCRFEGLPPIAEVEQQTGWLCSIIGDPSAQTHQSSWLRTPEGIAHLSCQFSDKPIADAVVQSGSLSATAQQAAFSLSLDDVPGKSVSGLPVDVGLGCAPITADLTGMIAVAERGVCAFTQKVQNALNAGATGIVVYNSAPFGDQVITMSGTSRVALPAVFVGRSTGLAILADPSSTVTLSYCGRSASCRGDL
jgi:hypothetical protein